MPICLDIAWVRTSPIGPPLACFLSEPPKVYKKFVITFLTIRDIASAVIIFLCFCVGVLTGGFNLDLTPVLNISPPTISWSVSLGFLSLGSFWVCSTSSSPRAAISSSSSMTNRNLDSSRSHTLMTAGLASNLFMMTGTTTSTFILGYQALKSKLPNNTFLFSSPRAASLSPPRTSWPAIPRAA